MVANDSISDQCGLVIDELQLLTREGKAAYVPKPVEVRGLNSTIIAFAVKSHFIFIILVH